MSNKDENVVVKLVKKAVGIPAAGSTCCGPVPPPAQDGGNAVASDEASAGCGCDSAAAQERQPPTKS